MEGNIDNVDTAATQSPSEPTIVINNQSVPISQAPEVLRSMEHSIKSGYDKKLADERAALASALDEDTAFYRDHADRPDLWGQYEPKVGGGRGFTGDASALAAKPTNTTAQPQQANPANAQAFGEQAKLRALERELASVKETLGAVVGYNDTVAKNAVVSTLDITAKKYPAADLDGVKAQLQIYYNANGQRHASPEIVEQMMKTSHDRISKKFNLQAPDPTPNTAMPSVKGGTTPSTPAKSVPNMFTDREGFNKFVSEHLE